MGELISAFGRQAGAPVAPETRIVAAAIKVGSMTISAPPPARHWTLIYAFHAYNRKHMVQPSEQGFLTSDGLFVSRMDALRIAQTAAQLRPGVTPSVHGLFSEDVW